MSNLSTYVAVALAAILVMDHAATIAPLRPAFELAPVPPGDVVEPLITINRALKGDRWEPRATRLPAGKCSVGSRRRSIDREHPRIALASPAGQCHGRGQAGGAGARPTTGQASAAAGMRIGIWKTGGPAVGLCSRSLHHLT